MTDTIKIRIATIVFADGDHYSHSMPRKPGQSEANHNADLVDAVESISADMEMGKGKPGQIYFVDIAVPRPGTPVVIRAEPVAPRPAIDAVCVQEAGPGVPVPCVAPADEPACDQAAGPPVKSPDDWGVPGKKWYRWRRLIYVLLKAHGPQDQATIARSCGIPSGSIGAGVMKCRHFVRDNQFMWSLSEHVPVDVPDEAAPPIKPKPPGKKKQVTADTVYLPTPEEIAAEAAAIRQEWSPGVAASRNSESGTVPFEVPVVSTPQF